MATAQPEHEPVNDIADVTYRNVVQDLRHLASTLKDNDRAVKAGNLAHKISEFSEENPAPKELQDQISAYEHRRQPLTLNLVKRIEQSKNELDI